MARDAQTIRGEYARRADEIKHNDRLSNRGKLEALEEAHEAAQAELHDLRDREVADLEAKRDRLTREAFGPSGDVTMSAADARRDLRDATAKADAATTPEDAMRMLNRAERTGDRALAVGVASVAHERGWHNVLPKAGEVAGRGDKLAELGQVHEQLNGSAAQVGRSIAYSLPRPKL